MYLHYEVLLRAEQSLPIRFDKNYLYAKFQLFLRKFNLWAVRRSKGEVQPIGASMIDKLKRNIEKIGEQETEWNFSTEMLVDNTQRLLEVFQGIWCTKAPITEAKYTNRPNCSSLPPLDFPVLSTKGLSYLFFNIYTDESRDTIYLKIKSAALSGGRVEQQEMLLEAQGLAEAEAESRRADAFAEVMNERRLRLLFSRANQALYHQSSKTLFQANKKNDEFRRRLLDQAGSCEHLVSAWISNSGHDAYMYVCAHAGAMHDDCGAFSETDVITSGIKGLLDEVIFSATDACRCHVCKLTFASVSKLNRHLKHSDSHTQEASRQRQEKNENEIAQLQDTFARQVENKFKFLKQKQSRQLYYDVVEIEDENPKTTHEQAVELAQAKLAGGYRLPALSPSSSLNSSS